MEWCLEWSLEMVETLQPIIMAIWWALWLKSSKVRICCYWVRESNLIMYKCKEKNAWEYICTYLYHQIKTFIAWFIINLSFLLKVTKLLQCILFNKIIISWLFLYQFLWPKDIFVAKKEYNKLLSYVILKFPSYTILYSIYY